MKLRLVLPLFSVSWPLQGSSFSPTTRNKTTKSSPRSSIMFLSSEGDWTESQRKDCKELLHRIEVLQDEIQGMNGTKELLQAQLEAVEAVELDAEALMAQPIPPLGITMEEYDASMRTFFNLPPLFRLALVKALEMDDSSAGDLRMIPTIVIRLYEERSLLTPQRLSNSLKIAQRSQVASTKPQPSGNSDAKSVLQDFLDKDPDELALEQNVRQLLPRVTRKEGVGPTPKDLEALTSILESSLFSATGRPVKIPGGYLISGKNRKPSGKELIDALDSKLPSRWNCTVCYMPDISRFDEDSFFEERGNALLLLKDDFSPSTNPWFYRITTAVALLTTLLFCVGVYGANEVVLHQLEQASDLGDFGSLDWFNGKVEEVLVPLSLILFSHEVGHFLISRKEKIETPSFLPTLLPAWGNLPLLGTLTRIKTSPRNLTALFDFAFQGPLLGFISSFIFLGVGLLATKAALDSGGSAAEYLPALPVSALKISTLGGSLVDYFFSGGSDGYFLSQDPTTAVPLHPFAIAGFCGLLINAVELLPLGSTDGGRLSQALFGRTGHSIVGGFTWLALLIASFAVEDQKSTLLVTAWALNNIFQNDMEIPCRDETDDIGLSRSLAAFAMWFLALLTLVPV